MSLEWGTQVWPANSFVLAGRAKPDAVSYPAAGFALEHLQKSASPEMAKLVANGAL